MLRKFLSQVEEICGLTGEAVPILSMYDRHASSNYQVPHAVHAGPLQAGAALAGVLDLLEDLVAFAGSVVSEGLELLGQGVA